jgi:transcriptional regulator
MGKASKAIQTLITEQALQKSIISKQNAQLQMFKIGKTKRKIAKDPNTRFANIEMVKKAMEEAELRKQQLQARMPELEAQKVSEAASKATFESHLFEWQAY